MTQDLFHEDEMKLHTLLSEMHSDTQVVDLHAPAPAADHERSTCSDAPTEVDAVVRSSPVRRGAKRERALVEDIGPSVPSLNGATSIPLDDEDPSVRREHHNKHTRKCRAKLKGKFDAVLEMLPDPPANQEVKHKTQILEYTMEKFRSLRTQLSDLEMTLALQSNRKMLGWIDQFARKEEDIASVLMPFLDIFCMRRRWVYAEVWRPASIDLEPRGDQDAPRDMFVERFVVHEAAWTQKPITDNLRLLGERFTRNQEVIASTDPQLQLTVRRLQPQVTNGLMRFDGASHRMRLLAEAGIGTTMLVPVIVEAEVVRVVAFHDTREVPVTDEMKSLAMFIATSIGNAHNAAQCERTINDKHLAGAGRVGRPSRS